MPRIFLLHLYLLATIFLLQLVISAGTSIAKTARDSTWQSHAEIRIKGIYERGEFRPKSFSPKWLSDSSGFLLDDVDSTSRNQTTWFFDATTGGRRSATNDEVATRSNVGCLSVELQLEVRDDKLIAVSKKTNGEITLAKSAANREVDFRKPVLSPDGARVLFVEADYTDVRQRWVLVYGDPSCPEMKQNPSQSATRFELSRRRERHRNSFG